MKHNFFILIICFSIFSCLNNEEKAKQSPIAISDTPKTESPFYSAKFDTSNIIGYGVIVLKTEKIEHQGIVICTGNAEQSIPAFQFEYDTLKQFELGDTVSFKICYNNFHSFAFDLNKVPILPDTIKRATVELEQFAIMDWHGRSFHGISGNHKYGHFTKIVTENNIDYFKWDIENSNTDIYLYTKKDKFNEFENNNVFVDFDFGSKLKKLGKFYLKINRVGLNHDEVHY